MRSILWGYVLFLLVTTLPAAATSTIAVTEEELVARANAVVVGHIAETHSFWNESHTAIFTDTRIEVEDNVLGSVPSTLTVRTIGGRVGKFWLEADGEPLFRAGERQLLFLTDNQDGTYRVLGYRLGQYRIQINQEGVDIAVPASGSAPRYKESKNGKVPFQLRALQLEQLKQQIRSTASRVKTGH